MRQPSATRPSRANRSRPRPGLEPELEPEPEPEPVGGAPVSEFAASHFHQVGRSHLTKKFPLPTGRFLNGRRDHSRRPLPFGVSGETRRALRDERDIWAHFAESSNLRLPLALSLAAAAAAAARLLTRR